MVSFKVTKKDARLIQKIAERAATIARNTVPVVAIEMDITAAHANGNKLRLEELLKADDFNLAHDVFGIRRHIDRNTGELTDCFVPRFSAQMVGA
jgi:hypothetical protein